MAVTTEVTALEKFDVATGVDIAVAIPIFLVSEVVVTYGRNALPTVINVDFTVVKLDVSAFSTFVLTPTAALLTKINALIASDDTEINSIVVRRVLPLTSPATPANASYTAFISQELDRAAARDQQQQDRIEHSLQTPLSYVGATPLLLPPFTANTSLVISEDGSVVKSGPTVDEIAGAQEAGEIAAAAAETAVEAASMLEGTAAILVPTNGPMGTWMAIQQGRSLYLGNDARGSFGGALMGGWFRGHWDLSRGQSDSTLGNLSIFGQYNLLDMIVTGDSRVNYGFLCPAIQDICHARGLPWVRVNQLGYSSKNSSYILSTGLPAILAHANFATTRLVVYVGSINELFADTGSPVQTRAQTKQNIIDFIDGIRAVKDETACSILLTSPVPAAHATNPQTMALARALARVYQEVSELKGVAFWNPLSRMSDAKMAGGYYNVDLVHPTSLGDADIAGWMCDDVIAPPGLSARWSVGCRNYALNSLSPQIKVQTDLPNTYPFGEHVQRAITTGSAWPLDGIVETYRSTSRITRQILTDRTTGVIQTRVSPGGTNTWGAWAPVDVSTEDVIAPATGYTTPAVEIAKVVKSGKSVQVCGHWNITTPAASIATGTTVGTVPVGFRPRDTNLDLTVCASVSGITFDHTKARVSTAGVITLMEDVVLASADRLYLFGSWATV